MEPCIRSALLTQSLILLSSYQSFKELPKLLDLGLRETASLSPDVGDDMDLGPRETASLSPGVGDDLQLREEEDSPPPVLTTKPRTSKSNPPSPRVSNQSPALPGQLSNDGKRAEVRKSHSSSLTSLGESAVSERRGSKLQPASRRVLSQVSYSVLCQCG